MCNEGAEPRQYDTLLWVVTSSSFWSTDRSNVSSQKYKKTKFSAFVERLQDENQTLEYAVEKWGNRPYGIVRFTYKDAKDCGYLAHFKLEDGNKAHVDVTHDLSDERSKGMRAQALLHRTTVARPWGRAVTPRSS